MDETALQQSALLGSVWETFVYAELRKTCTARAPDHQLWFYRDQQGREVDFLVQGGGGFTCIECKWAELPQPSDARWLRDVTTLLQNARPAPLFVTRWISARPASSYPLEDVTRVVHGTRLAQELFPNA